ncbi:uncharacterized protein DSM5745_05488 [Aspergillus mulundensis]|uniref:LYC1 C-terminal domain-containing protein n=1 Tax=Aspergillus mulundensis TaxID=1810919 RepID=A0A3D8RXB5_9EURO|nr:Uncharacterized protein DSM5745_05488 [Aspergillus mulundensis]RDW78636.1 Uncharacterized protein DSM5745_05488 [Aspergillus mulundensis]
MIAAYADTDLPHGDSPELTLVQATPTERVESIKLNSTEWKGPLDLDSYLAREDTLLQQRLTKEALICWILVDRRAPENARTILSSCETYKKTAVVAQDGNVEEASVQGVGSVYCRPEFRGKGYAKRMLEELSKKMDAWQLEGEQSERPLFSILFSDIGKRFYAQFGWKPHPSSHFALPPLSKEEYSTLSTTAAVKVLRADDVQRCMCSIGILEKERELLRGVSLQSSGPKVAIVPDFDHYQWHWAREEFYCQRLYPDRGIPAAKGAGNDAVKVYCAWNRTFGNTPEENTLYILRWVYDEPASQEETETTIKAMAAILRRAQLEAHEWNMAHVTFWNPTPLLHRAVALLDPAVEIVHREKDSIAALRWSGNPEENVEWLLNEKYAWC